MLLRFHFSLDPPAHILLQRKWLAYTRHPWNEIGNISCDADGSHDDKEFQEFVCDHIGAGPVTRAHLPFAWARPASQDAVHYAREICPVVKGLIFCSRLHLQRQTAAYTYYSPVDVFGRTYWEATGVSWWPLQKPRTT